MRRVKRLLIVGLAAAAGLLVSCGGSTDITPAMFAEGNGAWPGGADRPGTATDGLDLRGFAVASADGAGQPELTLAVDQHGGQLTVSVKSAAPLALSQLLCEVHYDQAQYTPLAAQATAAIAPPAESLCLQVLDTPGLVSLGQVALGGAVCELPAGAALAEVLFACEPSKEAAALTVSDVPVHAKALSPLLWNEQSGELLWYLVNPGDYNQDGLVSVSDLSPLGREFGAAGPFAFDSVLAVIDGNGDGVIGVADLATIGQYWGSRVEGYNLYASDDIGAVPISFAEPSSIEPLASFSLDQAQGDPLTDRLLFSFVPEPGQDELLYWVRPFGDGAEGTRSNVNGPGLDSVPVDPGGDGFNLPPTARLSLDYEGSSVPLAVTFDAGASSDPDGRIIFFEWDYQGDGLFDAFSSEAVAEHTYVQPGSYAPLVRVTDNGGLWDTFQSPSLEVTDTQVSNIPPLADIMATLTGGQAPLAVGLLATGSVDPDGYIVRYEWDFDGDGDYDLDSGTDPTVLHTYTTAGTRDATVRVTDNRGDSAVDEFQIDVTAPPPPNYDPIAALDIDTAYGDAPLTVRLDGSVSIDTDGQIAAYDWDFNGDGAFDATGSSSIVTHTYHQHGVYIAQLRVTDDAGGWAVAHAEVRVNEILAGPGIWSCFGHDSRHTHRSPYVGSQTASMRWAYDVGLSTASSPVIAADGTVYVGNNSDGLLAIGPDGSRLWSYTTDGRWASSPAIGADGSIYVGSLPTKLYAMNPDGSYKWSYATDGGVYSPPSIGADGVIYVGSTDRRLYAVYPDGSLKWSHEVGAQIYGSPAVAPEGVVYTGGSAPHSLRAINPDGSLAWTFDAGGTLVGSPAIGADGTVYMCSSAHALLAVNPDGTLQWAFNTIDYVESSPAIGADGAVYVGTSGGVLLAVNADGTYRWSFDAGGWINSSPAIGADGTIYFGCYDHLVYAVTPEGDLKWSFATDSQVSSSPAIGADGTIYVGSAYGKLYALGRHDVEVNVVDGAENSGDYSSLAVVSGRPAISYYSYDSYNRSLMYVRANNASGSSWNSRIVVDTELGSAVGEYTSLAIVKQTSAFAGYPAISYYDYDEGLKYVRATDANGGAWSTPVVVDAGASIGLYTSLAVVATYFGFAGYPAVSYYDEANDDLKYVCSRDPRGDYWWDPPVTVDSAGAVGQYTSLAVVHDATHLLSYPAISYYDETNGDLKYVRGVDSRGDSWGTPIVVDAVGDVGMYTSLAMVDGCPAISYYDATNGDLRFVRADDFAGDTWGTPAVVDSDGDVGRHTSLAVINGTPAISYVVANPRALKCITAADASGTSWAAPVEFNGYTDSYRQGTSLAEVNGRQGISFGTGSHAILRYAY